MTTILSFDRNLSRHEYPKWPRLNHVALAAILFFAIPGFVMAREVTLYFSQVGSASDSTKQAAHDEAYQQAQDALNGMCVGTIVNMVETGTTYFDLSTPDQPQFSAMVFVRGACQVGGR